MGQQVPEEHETFPDPVVGRHLRGCCLDLAAVAVVVVLVLMLVMAVVVVVEVMVAVVAVVGGGGGGGGGGGWGDGGGDGGVVVVVVVVVAAAAVVVVVGNRAVHRLQTGDRPWRAEQRENREDEQWIRREDRRAKRPWQEDWRRRGAPSTSSEVKAPPCSH